MNALDVLRQMGACWTGIDEVREAGTFRAAWECSTSSSNMMWLLGALHRSGAISRRRLVRVAVRCAETCAHLMPEDARPLLADISAWCDGDDTIDLPATRAALATIRQRQWNAAHCAADAFAADAATAAADAADAFAAAAFAADAFAAAADAADAFAAAAFAADAATAAADAATAAAFADAAAADAADAFAAAAAAAMCDVIRDEVDADEAAAAMGINADEVLS